MPVCVPVCASCCKKHGGGVDWTLEKTGRFDQKNPLRFVSHVFASPVLTLPTLSSALSKEEDVDTAGGEEPYDPGVRRGSNYKTPMERSKSNK